MNNLLITKADISQYFGISDSLNVEKQLDMHIWNAQQVDVKQVFGNAFWTDLSDNADTDMYIDLLEGKTYTNEAGVSVSFAGLKTALCFYAYARYINFRNSQDTPFGNVVKRSDYSDPVDPKILFQQSNQIRIDAAVFLNECIDFIKTFPSIYTLFDLCNASVTSIGSYVTKIV